MWSTKTDTKQSYLFYLIQNGILLTIWHQVKRENMNVNDYIDEHGNTYLMYAAVYGWYGSISCLVGECDASILQKNS